MAKRITMQGTIAALRVRNNELQEQLAEEGALMVVRDAVLEAERWAESARASEAAALEDNAALLARAMKAEQRLRVLDTWTCAVCGAVHPLSDAGQLSEAELKP